MKSIEMEGKTVEEALDKALEKLQLEKSMVNVEILEHGSKGLFNVIGVKRAKVKVSIKYDYIDEADKFLKNMFLCMGLDSIIKIEEENDTVRINVSGENMGTIIGYRGETLDAIQYLVSLVINKVHDIPHKKVILDTENYRSKREETLRSVARKAANKVLKTKRNLKLEPMNPYERRIIHSALQDNEYVSTHSEGEEPFRRVVIELNKKL